MKQWKKDTFFAFICMMLGTMLILFICDGYTQAFIAFAGMLLFGLSTFFFLQSKDHYNQEGKEEVVQAV